MILYLGAGPRRRPGFNGRHVPRMRSQLAQLLLRLGELLFQILYLSNQIRDRQLGTVTIAIANELTLSTT